jgi:DNA (cytosine-5)-methyltransferase 1
LALRGRRSPTLAEVVAGCSDGYDTVWGHHYVDVTDNSPGLSLSWEEERINREKKQNHPIYNDMAFPDNPDKTARTITATCTKVSRESIVVPDGSGGYRLLTAREMAAVQSFPLSYQFPAKGQNDRVKMAGNAIPPLFTYMVGLAVRGLKLPDQLPKFTPLNGKASFASSVRPISKNMRSDRSFRASIAELRFKSGMSFEINNSEGQWKMVFNQGGPGRILSLSVLEISTIVGYLSDEYMDVIPSFTSENIQNAWDNSLAESCHPYMVIDAISSLISGMALNQSQSIELVHQAYAIKGISTPNKAILNYNLIASGLILADAFNRKIRNTTSKSN